MFLPSAELDSEQQNEAGHFQTLFSKSSSRTCQKDGETTLVSYLRTDSVQRILDSSNCHYPERNISVKLGWREGLPSSPSPKSLRESSGYLTVDTEAGKAGRREEET